MSEQRTLTGRTRHELFKPLIGSPLLFLQVEERRVGSILENGGGRVESRDYDFTVWRKATVIDLQELQKE